jgi:uncharacterized protein (TIGR03083 family)
MATDDRGADPTTTPSAADTAAGGTADDIDPRLQAYVAAVYTALAGVLERLPDEAWGTASLCEGWRVREVVAHTTMPVRYDEASFMEELRIRNFDFGRLSNDVAARDGALAPGTLLAQLNDRTLHHWVPPKGGSHGALNHAVIHALDVTVALGVELPMPPGALETVLDDLVGGAHAYFGTAVTGRRFEATDIDWSHGTGSPVVGPASSLALALCGRRLPAGSLEGGPL